MHKKSHLTECPLAINKSSLGQRGLYSYPTFFYHRSQNAVDSRGARKLSSLALDRRETPYPPAPMCYYSEACSAKMAGYYPCSFFVLLWTLISLRSIKTRKKNLANIQPPWPHHWSIMHMYYTHLWSALQAVSLFLSFRITTFYDLKVLVYIRHEQEGCPIFSLHFQKTTSF